MIPTAGIENESLKVTSELSSPQLGVLLKLALHQSSLLNLWPIHSESIMPLSPSHTHTHIYISKFGIIPKMLENQSYFQNESFINLTQLSSWDNSQNPIPII